MPRLENWSVLGTSYGFLVPEVGTRLVGEVYGHKMYGNGAKIKTSVTITFDLTNKVAETQNTIYVLGEVDREYKKWCEERGFSYENCESRQGYDNYFGGQRRSIYRR